MKTELAVLFILISGSSMAQDPKLQNVSKPEQDCEKLVFNTRELKPFDYNTACKTESYPFISSDGQHLYFTNNQTYNWIFYSFRDSATGVWSVPVPIEIGNFQNSLMSCYLSQDRSTLYFTSNGLLYKCNSIEGSAIAFSQPENILILNVSDVVGDSKSPFSNLSFTEDFQYMMAYTAGPSSLSMAYYVKSGDNTYTFVKFISTTPKEMGFISNNGLTYYFTNSTYKNILFSKKRNTLNEDFGNEVYAVKTFESNLSITQLRIAETGNSMVMVLSENIWDKNDIYFLDFNVNDPSANWPEFNASLMQNNKNDINVMAPSLIPGKEAAKPVKTVEIINHSGLDICKIDLGNPFPNPAKNTFYFYYNVKGENPNAEMPLFVLLDNAGRIVYSQRLEQMMGEAKILLDDIPSGIYLIRIDYNGISSEISKITITM